MTISTNPKSDDLSSLDPIFSQPLGAPSSAPSAKTTEPEAESEDIKDLHSLDPIFSQPLGPAPGAVGENTPSAASAPISPLIPAAAGAGLGVLANSLETPTPPTPKVTPNQLAQVHTTLEGKKNAVSNLEKLYETVLDEQNQKLSDLHLNHQGAQLRLADTSKAVQDARAEAEKFGLTDLPNENEPKPKMRASGPKIEGESGVKNWMKAEAGQKHQLPEEILNLATDKTKTSETGAKALIDEDLRRLKKIKEISSPREEYELVGEGKNQLMLQKGTKTPSVEKAAQDEIERQKMLKLQADAQKKFDIAFEEHQKARIEAAKAEGRLNSFSSKKPAELTKAEQTLQKAQVQAAELEAKLKAMLNLPQATKFDKVLQVMKGLSKPVGGAMTLGELTNAIEEFKAGHNKEGALSLLGTAGGALMTSPNPYAKGAGALMSAVPLGVQAYEAYKDYTKPPQ